MRELLLEFLRYHYKDNPFRKEHTNEKEVDEFLALRMGSLLVPKDCSCNLVQYPDQLELCGECLKK